MDETKSRPIYQGLALIAIGLIFILGNFGAFHPDWELVFALIIMVMGVLFWLGFLRDRSRDFHHHYYQDRSGCPGEWLAVPNDSSRYLH